MHDGMQSDPIQGQGHEPLKVGNPFIFKNDSFSFGLLGEQSSPKFEIPCLGRR